MSDALNVEGLRLLKETIADIVAIWSKRHHRAAVKDASDLVFWKDGMRGVLERIAGGDGTPWTFQDLQHRFQETKDDVEEIADRLRLKRDQIAAQPGGIDVARRIDDFLHGPVGKMGIRYAINQIIAHPDDKDVPAKARSGCNQIDAFNAEVRRLHVLAFGN